MPNVPSASDDILIFGKIKEVLGQTFGIFDWLPDSY